MKVRKELWFGFGLMAIIGIAVVALMPWGNLTNGHLGLLMLALIVVAIMLGFPTAFTLMGMGVFFGWLAYRSVNPALAGQQVFDVMVQRTYGVMSNDVLIAIPLFLFMGYLVERAQLIDRLFRSLHLATARVPGSLAVATIVTCAIFATATGIVGAVVTLMGLLAFPAMLKAGYNIQISAGAVTAGGCLGILIPPSVLLIVYGATAGVSVVQLYAGAFFPGLMLASLYLGLCHRAREVEAPAHAPARRERAPRPAPAVRADARAAWRLRIGGVVARAHRRWRGRRRKAHGGCSALRFAATGARYRCAGGRHLSGGHRAGGGSEHGRAGRGRRGGGRGRQGGIRRSNRPTAARGGRVQGAAPRGRQGNCFAAGCGGNQGGSRDRAAGRGASQPGRGKPPPLRHQSGCRCPPGSGSSLPSVSPPLR